MADDDFDPADIQRSYVLKQRVEACRQFRENSKTTGDAYKLKDVPYLFRPNAGRPTVPYLCIPSVVSETRRFFTAERLDSFVISSNLVFQTPDEDGLQFGLISSSMFMAWQKNVGGRLESRLRFANTFPVPELTEQQRNAIIAGGKAVLDARALRPQRSLAEHYVPLAMSPELLAAHKKLDRAVDTAMGVSKLLSTEKQRLEILFQNYVKLTS